MDKTLIALPIAAVLLGGGLITAVVTLSPSETQTDLQSLAEQSKTLDARNAYQLREIQTEAPITAEQHKQAVTDLQNQGVIDNLQRQLQDRATDNSNKTLIANASAQKQKTVLDAEAYEAATKILCSEVKDQDTCARARLVAQIDPGVAVQILSGHFDITPKPVTHPPSAPVTTFEPSASCTCSFTNGNMTWSSNVTVIQNDIGTRAGAWTIIGHANGVYAFRNDDGRIAEVDCGPATPWGFEGSGSDGEFDIEDNNGNHRHVDFFVN